MELTPQEEPGRKAPAALPTAAGAMPRRAWRSGLFWRMMSGALIAFAALLITAGLSLRVINGLVTESDRMHHTFDTAARVKRFAVSLNGAYNALNTLRRPNYQPYYYADEHAEMLAALADLTAGSTDPALTAMQQARISQLVESFRSYDAPLQRLNDQARTDQVGALRLWQEPPSNYEEKLRTLRTGAQSLASELDSTSEQSIGDMH